MRLSDLAIRALGRCLVFVPRFLMFLPCGMYWHGSRVRRVSGEFSGFAIETATSAKCSAFLIGHRRWLVLSRLSNSNALQKFDNGDGSDSLSQCVSSAHRRTWAAWFRLTCRHSQGGRSSAADHHFNSPPLIANSTMINVDSLLIRRWQIPSYVDRLNFVLVRNNWCLKPWVDSCYSFGGRQE